jgi:hypothetical protein
MKVFKNQVQFFGRLCCLLCLPAACALLGGLRLVPVIEITL